MNFSNAMNQYQNLTRTENDAVALSTTKSKLLDMFASAGAMRNRSHGEVERMFLDAMQEDKLLATKMMFYTRNIRGGLGERKTFRSMLYSLAVEYPDIVRKNIRLIPQFGRWDDLYTLIGTPVEEDMWNLVRKQWKADFAMMENKFNISLMAKWLKSVNTSSKESCFLGKATAKALGLSQRKYRKTLSAMRKYIDVVEKKMSKNKWEDINYESVPSLAMKNYRNAFKKHDEEGFSYYIGSVASGEKKINASTLYPYDILKSGGLGHSFTWHTEQNQGSYTLVTHDIVLEEQWKALPNYVKGEVNALVMADTSGSMNTDNQRPIATAIGLAIYFAERNSGAYKDKFITFSERPSMVFLKGNNLREKVECVPYINSNTNIEKAFQLILEIALENRVPQEEMPASLIVISDMEFDYCVENKSQLQTHFQKMEKMYEQYGYKMPSVIFWNVESRHEAFQVDADKPNTILVSGQSPSMFKNVMGSVGKTPYEFMVETLNDPLYDEVKI